MKLKIMWKMGVKDTQEQGQSQGHRGVWSQYCLWNFNHNKIGKKTLSVLTFGGIVAFDSLWSL